MGLFSGGLPEPVPESTEFDVCIIDADVVAILFPSFDAHARSRAELRRIMIVLVCGNLRLCSRNPSSL